MEILTLAGIFYPLISLFLLAMPSLMQSLTSFGKVTASTRLLPWVDQGAVFPQGGSQAKFAFRDSPLDLGI